jgi:hypothetical protein
MTKTAKDSHVGLTHPFVLGMFIAALTSPTAAAQSTRQVTFSKDVAPILQRSCVTCHRAGQMAPMSLETYEEVRPWGGAIKRRVATREMPPWHIDRNIGIQKFKDDPSLSDDEIGTIVRWVDSGAPKGDPSDMPPPRKFAEASAWQIGEPDLVIRFPAYTVPAAGPDLFGNLYAEIPIEEDRYIKAVQTRPVGLGSRKVVHHALSYAVDGDQTTTGGDDGSADAGQFLVEYASGKNGEIYPENSGVLLPADKKAMVSYHLHSIGEETKTEIELGFVFYPKGTVPKHIRWSQVTASSQELDIPAGTVVRRDTYKKFYKAARLTAYQPHMHIRGKAQCLELIYPNATTEVVNCVQFNYNWHLVYNYADDSAPLIPAGTILHIISWHDNSESNRSNPDASNWVGYGQRTIDEMGFAWIGWYDLTDDEYAQELETRKKVRQEAARSSGQQH